MFNLIPYSNRRNGTVVYNPFRIFDDLEKNFFGSDSIAEFKTDIQDTGDSFVMATDLPGFQKEDIKIDLHEGVLTINAERHSEYEENDKKQNFVRCERSFGSYSRSFGIDDIQTDAIKASYENGVLKLVLPKKVATEATSRRLAIE